MTDLGCTITKKKHVCYFYIMVLRRAVFVRVF